MAQAVKGKSQILLFRLLRDAASAKAAKLAFQTEHSTEKKRDSDVTETKDGSITIGKALEEEVPFTSIMAAGDPVVKLLETAINENEILEIWEVDITEKTKGGKYPAYYRQGLLTELNKTANAEDLIEIEGTFATNGTAVQGEVTLSEEQENVVQYAFRDTSEYKPSV